MPQSRGKIKRQRRVICLHSVQGRTMMCVRCYLTRLRIMQGRLAATMILTLQQIVCPTTSHLGRGFYCSRTHSQLSQFVSEFKRSKTFSSSLSIVALGSRSQLCTNDKLRKHARGDGRRFNEGCLSMQRDGKKDKEKRCSLISKHAVTKMRDYALYKPMDVEDLRRAGEMHGDVHTTQAAAPQPAQISFACLIRCSFTRKRDRRWSVRSRALS